MQITDGCLQTINIFSNIYQLFIEFQNIVKVDILIGY